MNEKQAYLLKLLKEIDGICRENDIRYYLAAGTMLGAIRHRGFIPWDDDADIIMTKANYDKFIRFFETHKVKNRVFQYRGNNPLYPMIIGRYYDKESTGVQRATGWDIIPAGQYIDVMILIPLPKEEKLKQKTIERIIFYVELNNDMYTDNGNRGDSYTRKYKWMLRLRKLVGKERLLKWLEKKIFCFSEEECDEFMISHAIGNTLTFKKNFFGMPQYVPFEDTQLPIAENYMDLFWYGYGSAWRMIPPEIEQQTHSVVDDFERPYSLYVDDYMRFLDKETVLSDVRKFKKTSVFNTNKKRPFSKGIHLINAMQIKLQIEERIKREKIDLDEWVRERKFHAIEELFSPYFKLQFKKTFSYWGLFFDIDDELLYYPLYMWVYYSGEYQRAEKILKLRRREKGEILPERLKKLSELISMIIDTYRAYDYNERERLKQLVSEGHKRYSEQVDFWLFYLRFLRENAEQEHDYRVLHGESIKMLRLFPENGDCMKYVADSYLGMGETEKAMRFYEYAESLSRNGQLLCEIKDIKEGYKNEFAK